MSPRVITLVSLLGCVEVEPCESLGDASASPGGLLITQEEHGPGWSQDECFTCHQTWNIHQFDCIGGVDLEAVEALADPEDVSSCVQCHGANGVPWLEVYTESAQR